VGFDLYVDFSPGPGLELKLQPSGDLGDAELVGATGGIDDKLEVFLSLDGPLEEAIGNTVVDVSALVAR
jgi:hypothetical protein